VWNRISSPRHFPVQQVARATYREILERRAKENSVDFIEGVATAITPLAFLETVMVKGYQTLVEEGTTVSYRDGMEAALKLNEIARKDGGAIDRARMLADMGRIIEVVRTFIPSERWPVRRGPRPPSRRPSAWLGATPSMRAPGAAGRLAQDRARSLAWTRAAPGQEPGGQRHERLDHRAVAVARQLHQNRVAGRVILGVERAQIAARGRRRAVELSGLFHPRAAAWLRLVVW
jgi:hypothetical protein